MKGDVGPAIGQQMERGGYQFESQTYNLQPTMRQMTSTDVVTLPGYNKEQGYLANPVVMKPTSRESTCQVSHTTPANANVGPALYNYMYNAEMSDRRNKIETELAKHYPTNSNYDKGPQLQLENVRLKNNPRYTYVAAPSLFNYYSSQPGIMGELTQNGISTPMEDVRLDPCILEILKTNQLMVNSMWGFPYGQQDWMKVNPQMTELYQEKAQKPKKEKVL